MSKVYRFHGPAENPQPPEQRLLSKRKKSVTLPMYLIAADTSSVTDKNGTYPIEEYQPILGHRIVTLTRRESNLVALANPGLPPPMALEDLHPWLPKQHYLNNSVASFTALVVTIKKFGSHFFDVSAYCEEKWNTVCNSLRRKSFWDTRFYNAWHLPIQDVYVLEEFRTERNVVSIDFNGMYLACMQHPFPSPADLKLVYLNRLYRDSEILPCGLYRCIIEKPLTNFIIRYNPFRSFHSGRYLQARIDEPIEVDLNEFEIAYYKKHFQIIRLTEAVISEKQVKHPLAKEALRSFAKRKNYRNQGNKALADREKYLATLMTSCTNRPVKPLYSFETNDDAMAHLHSIFGINPPLDEAATATTRWLQGRKGITITTGNSLINLKAANINDGSACFLLGQRIIARSRIVLLKMMEKILNSAPDINICYTNIDSIHFTLPNNHLDSVLAWLKSECSEELGSFKIESVTKHGLWLEPGRYWLYSDNIEKFRNRSVGNQQEPFKEHSIHIFHRKLGELHIPIKAKIHMERTMSPSRSLTTDTDGGLVNQHLIEVGNTTTTEEVLNQLERNQCHSTPIRIAAFKALKARMGSS